MGCPTQCILGENLTFTLQARSVTGTPIDTDAVPTYKVYEDETGTEILSGSMAKLDDANTTGLYSEQISCTAANGFERYKSYTIHILSAIGTIAVGKTYTFLCLAIADTGVTASTGALTSTSNFKDYIGLSGSTYDTLIENLIARATSAIEKYCDRTLTSASYVERRNGSGMNDIQLDQYPITAVSLLALSTQDALRIINTSSDAYHAYVTISSTTMTLYISGGTNAGNDALTLSSYTIAELVTAINALSKGWSATSQSTDLGQWESAELLTCSGRGCLDVNAYFEVPGDPVVDFVINDTEGSLFVESGFPGGRENIVIKYTAGYATTPADLEQICIDLVNLYYKSRTTDTSVKAEKLGDHSITYRADSEGSSRDLPKSFRVRLAPYKKWRI